LEKFALEHGVPEKLSRESQNMSYHKIPSTLPFSQEFTISVKTKFLREYVLNKERLLHVLPYQMEQFSTDELSQKYKGYFPTRVNSLKDLLKIARIDPSELRPTTSFDESQIQIPDLEARIREKFPLVKKRKDALRLLLIDISALFSNNTSEYNVIEPPLGLMALLSYINQEFKDSVEGMICKSRIDFDSYEELYNLIRNFNPDIIGIRTINFYKCLFHEIIAYIRKRGITAPIIVGGPYPTGSYTEVMQDRNIDLIVIGEGEITLSEILGQILTNNKRFPDREILKKISGIVLKNDD
jgi:hypothetical protein